MRRDGVSVIEDLEALSALENVWDAGLSADPRRSPILHHLWAQTFVEVYGPGAGLAVGVARYGDAIAIAPLLRPHARAHRLEFLSQREICEPMDFVYSDVAALDLLAEAIAAWKQPILLGRIPADSPTISALRRAFRRRAVVSVQPSWGCPWIDLDADWENPEQHINAGRRSDLRRAWRRAESLGAISTEIRAPSPAELPGVLDDAFVVEAASWKGRKGAALLHDTVQGEFYRRYAQAAASRGLLRTCFLRIGGRAAAMQLVLETDDRFWLLKIGYSDEFARCSPGILLMQETLRYAARRGLRAYEFLGNTEAWIRVWTPQERPCVSVRIYPFGMRGAMGLAIDALAVARQRLRRSA